MITSEGPKVVEYNCRFGDPETQVVLPLLQGDFLTLLDSAAIGIVDKNAVRYNGGSALCVVLSSNGYPDKYETGYEITGLNESDPSILIYHAGTKWEEDKIVTAGGRVLGVTAVNQINNIEVVKRKAYSAIQNIYFNGMYCRSDIGDKGINQQTVFHAE
jgi:phosphoribosylamine--glycine ligase